jgi:hypothetical protein
MGNVAIVWFPLPIATNYCSSLNFLSSMLYSFDMTTCYITNTIEKLLLRKTNDSAFKSRPAMQASAADEV